MPAETTKGISEALGEAMSRALLPLIASFQKLGKVFEKYGMDESVAMQLLKRYNLFLSPSLEPWLVSKLAEIGRKRGNHRAEIDQLLVEYFKSTYYFRLEWLVQGWRSNALFRPRMKIFRDCLTVLKTEKRGHNPSNVVLPALIAQIDGIRQCYLEKIGYSFKEVKGRYKWVDSQGQIVKWGDIYRSISSTNKLQKAGCDVFISVLFESSERGRRARLTFNRHKILHGECIRYGRIDNTIRAFLTLDFLYHLA